MRPVLSTSARIGNYVLQSKIGDGAYGTVWRARSLDDDHAVAIKIFCRDGLPESKIGHVLREARVTSQLSHPNIVKIHDVGVVGEYRYIVSELIEGVSLDAWLRRYRCAPRQAAQWCGIIARALQYAHDVGIIHRDLKPANIMVDHQENVFVMDFGLAKQVGDDITCDIERYQLAAYRLRQEEHSRESSGPILGTPAYMSPEQAQGEGYFVDQRSDIYSLGVILYELLAGTRPFRGNSRQLLQSIRKHYPIPPRWRNRHVPRSLEAICLKAMAKDPARRFATAAELADECDCFVRGEPTRTRATPRLGLLTRWMWSRVTSPCRR